MPRASIIIPAYNNIRTLARALDSALGQVCRFEFETIVVDDGSTDATPQLLERYAGRIIVRRQQNRGPAAARNAGAALADGEYVAFLDADDAFTPTKLAESVVALDSRPDTVLVFHDAIAVDSAGVQVAASYVTPDTARAPAMADLLERWWPILPTTAVLRRAVFVSLGGFVDEFRSPAYEDPYLWLMMRERGEFVYLPRALACYTVEPPAARMEKYLRGQEIFVRRVRERYGAAARGLILTTRHAYASALGYEGLLAIARGDMTIARSNFARALRHDPTSIRSAMRLLRTFIPLRLARALSGHTGRAAIPPASPK